MTKEHLEPAASIIEKIGVSEIAKIVSKHESRVYRWRMSKEKGGTGGVVPHEDAQKLLLEAQNGAFELAASDFFATQPEAAE